MKVEVTKKQHTDITRFYDLLKTNSGIIECFFIHPNGKAATRHYIDKEKFTKDVIAYNSKGFTCYTGIQPRHKDLLESGKPSSKDDITGVRFLYIDLDPKKPKDAKKKNATDEEKARCYEAATRIQGVWTDVLGYAEPILIDSGNGYWLYMPIPEIQISNGTRQEIDTRLKEWGKKIKQKFEDDAVEIDLSVFELHRITKIPGTRVFNKPHEKERPQRISSIITIDFPEPDEKLRSHFLSMRAIPGVADVADVSGKQKQVEDVEDRKTSSTIIKPIASSVVEDVEDVEDVSEINKRVVNYEKAFEECYLLRFLKEKNEAGINFPHPVRLALSSFANAANNLDEGLDFIETILSNNPDYSRSKTKYYLKANKDKCLPYGCEALRKIVREHFDDFDVARCDCKLPPTADFLTGKDRKPSPIRFIYEKKSEDTEDADLNLDKEIIPIHSFPFDIFSPGFMNMARLLSDAVHVETETTASLMLAIISGAVGNTIRISPKEGYEVPPFLWMIVIGESGTGKTPAIQALLSLVNKIQGEAYKKYKEEKKEYDRDLRKAKSGQDVEVGDPPAMRHYIVSDCTVEALADVFESDGRGVISHQDEIAALIMGLNQYKTKGNDRQHYLEMFNCNPIKIDRKSGTRYIPNTGFSILGGIQPRIMPRIFSEDAFDDGFLPRFLLLNTNDEALRFSTQSVMSSLRDYWEKLLSACYDQPIVKDKFGVIVPRNLPLGKKALDAWIPFYNDFMCSKRPYLSERARVFIPKLIGYYSLKFAGLLHVIKSLDNDMTINAIDENDVRGAIELTRFFAGQAIASLDLYDASGVRRRLNEFEKRLVETLYDLRGEVKGGMLPISRIGAHLNEKISSMGMHPITPEKVGRIIKKMGLVSKDGSGGYRYLLWEPEKIKNVFSKTSPTSPTSPSLRANTTSCKVEDKNQSPTSPTMKKMLGGQVGDVGDRKTSPTIIEPIASRGVGDVGDVGDDSEKRNQPSGVVGDVGDVGDDSEKRKQGEDEMDVMDFFEKKKLEAKNPETKTEDHISENKKPDDGIIITIDENGMMEGRIL